MRGKLQENIKRLCVCVWGGVSAVQTAGPKYPGQLPGYGIEILLKFSLDTNTLSSRGLLSRKSTVTDMQHVIT